MQFFRVRIKRSHEGNFCVIWNHNFGNFSRTCNSSTVITPENAKDTASKLTAITCSLLHYQYTPPSCTQTLIHCDISTTDYRLSGLLSFYEAQTRQLSLAQIRHITTLDLFNLTKHQSVLQKWPKSQIVAVLTHSKTHTNFLSPRALEAAVSLPWSRVGT